ncbi:hypothetical protein Gotur_025433 [Gossypium turneri]
MIAKQTPIQSPTLCTSEKPLVSILTFSKMRAKFTKLLAPRLQDSEATQTRLAITVKNTGIQCGARLKIQAFKKMEMRMIVWYIWRNLKLEQILLRCFVVLLLLLLHPKVVEAKSLLPYLPVRDASQLDKAIPQKLQMFLEINQTQSCRRSSQVVIGWVLRFLLKTTDDAELGTSLV